MTRIDIKAAAARFPELVKRVKQDEQIAITRDDKPVADHVAHQLTSGRAAFYGAWKGRVDMSRFDEADEEIAREFGLLD